MSYKAKVERIIETIYKMHNYTLDKEVKEVLLDSAQHKLISAPAGGTKTTLTQLIVALEKMHFMIQGTVANMKIDNHLDRVPTVIPRNRILCLVYNRHNAGDIDSVHAKFYNTMAQLGHISYEPIDRNYVEGGVKATTLHAYAREIINSNLSILKMREFNLAKEENIKAHFRSCVEQAMKESSVDVTQSIINEARTLYDLYVGLKLYETPESQPLTDSINFELALQGTLIPPKYLRDIFIRFDKRKKSLRINEFSDMLRYADYILKVPEIRQQYQEYFNIIVADEVQDFTPLMFSIYSALIGEKTKTITVGDRDQSIYSFLGAAENAIGRFEEIMGFQPKTFELSVNRRCKKETMDYALNVIESIDDRAPREIKTTKMGGTLTRIPYNEVTDQINAIDRLLKENVIGNTGILFRNKNQSIILSRWLYKRGIPANFINANNCMEHRLYTLFLDTINECFLNKSQKGLGMLNRILPFSRKALDEFLEVDKKTGISAKCPTATLWYDLDFTPLYATSTRYKSIEEQVEFAKKVAMESNYIVASDCLPKLLDMFYRNYFNFLSENEDDPYVELVLEWAKEDLGVGYSIRVAIENLYKNISLFMTSGRKVGKLNICTIHGTKGLEFNHVILNLEKDKVPPGLVLSPRAQKFQEDEENRLIYVASTRQIDSLTVLCNMRAKHRLSDESYFKGQEKLVIQSKFSAEKPDIFEDNLLSKVTAGRGRRSMLLED